MNRFEMAGALHALSASGWTGLAAALATAACDELPTALPEGWAGICLFPADCFGERLDRDLARRAIERFGRAAGIDAVGGRKGDADPRVPSMPASLLS